MLGTLGHYLQRLLSALRSMVARSEPNLDAPLPVVEMEPTIVTEQPPLTT